MLNVWSEVQLFARSLPRHRNFNFLCLHRVYSFGINRYISRSILWKQSSSHSFEDGGLKLDDARSAAYDGSVSFSCLSELIAHIHANGDHRNLEYLFQLLDDAAMLGDGNLQRSLQVRVLQQAILQSGKSSLILALESMN